MNKAIFLSALFVVAQAVVGGDLLSYKEISGQSGSDDKEWTVELGSGVLIDNVRTTDQGRTMIPVDLTAALQVDDVSLDHEWNGILRGYTEFLFRGYGMLITHGIENRIVGMNFGPRYNFVQEGWPVIPYVEGNVGFGFADTQGLTEGGRQVGLGQDFSFQFGVAGGFRYDINEDWFARLAAVYTHFSNAGQSEPERANRALDAFGPELSFGYKF